MKPLRVVGTVVLCLFCFGLGFGSGWLGARYSYTVLPEKKVREEAEKRQKELDKMVRRGRIASVEPDVLTVKVEKGGGDVGKTIALRTNEYTSVQIGMDFVNQPGRKLDLTQYFKAGDYVDALVKDGQALALHREFSPGERQPVVIEPTTRVSPEQSVPDAAQPQ
ncbi:MAG: hypothetical protein AB1700_00030 [Bacillota bacterium]